MIRDRRGGSRGLRVELPDVGRGGVVLHRRPGVRPHGDRIPRRALGVVQEVRPDRERPGLPARLLQRQGEIDSMRSQITWAS